MNKISKNEKGFTAVEGLLIVLILIVIGAVGYMVYHNDHRNKTASVSTTAATKPATSNKTTTTTTSPNPYAGWKTYTSSDNTYTIDYPSNWVTDPCSANNTCSTTAEVDTYVSPTTNPSWQVVELNHNKTTLSAQAWFNSSEDIPNPYASLVNASSASINGYPAYYVQVNDTSATSSTTSQVLTTDYYVVTHNGEAVMIQMPVQDGTNGDRNTAPLVPMFNQIAKSIVFHN